MEQKLENINQLDIGTLVYNYDFGNYKVLTLDKENIEFEIEIIDNLPTNWYEIIDQNNAKDELNIFNGNWFIIDKEQ